LNQTKQNLVVVCSDQQEKELLNRHFGKHFCLILTSSIQEATELFQKSSIPIHCAVIDDMSFEQTRTEAVETLHTLHPECKIVMLSSSENTDYWKELHNHGVYEHFLKPFSFDILIPKLKNIASLFQSNPWVPVSNSSDTQCANLLLIEDESRIRMALSKVLMRQHFKVFTAENAASGIDIVENTPSIDVVLLDIGLPDKSGVEALKEIKALRPDVEVIMLTAYYEHDLIVNCFHAGAFDYVVKPYDANHLQKTVARALEHRSQALTASEKHVHTLDSLMESVRHQVQIIFT